MFFKNFLPTSLFGRFLLIITLPVIIIQIITIYIFYERHWSNVTKHMATSLAGDIGLIVDTYQYDLEHNTNFMNIIYDNLYFNIEILDKDYNKIKYDYIVTHERLNDLLAQQIIYPYQVALINEESDLNVRIFMENNDLSISTTSKRLLNPTTSIFIFWIIGTASVLLIISIAISRNQIKAIARLSKVAERFGRGLPTKSFKPRGAKEVRQAAHAFLSMQERINRYIAQRTKMLAGISHDLRTPLTRVKLQLEMLDCNQDDLKELKNDINVMELMINSYLNFAKNDYHEEVESVDFSIIVNRLKEHFNNADVIFDNDANINIYLKMKSFMRALTNLINNGLQYGNKVIVKSFNTNDNFTIIIEDNGPGIPIEYYDDVFKPFFRIDESRHIEKGSVGLGLAIVQDVINAHGGEITLGKSSLGGLLVSINIPI